MMTTIDDDDDPSFISWVAMHYLYAPDIYHPRKQFHATARP